MQYGFGHQYFINLPESLLYNITFYVCKSNVFLQHTVALMMLNAQTQTHRMCLYWCDPFLCGCVCVFMCVCVCSIQFNSILFVKHNKKMLYRGRNPEPEPPGKHSGKEKLPFNRKKPWAGPGLQGRAFLLRVSWVKEEKKRKSGQREQGQTNKIQL